MASVLLGGSDAGKAIAVIHSEPLQLFQELQEAIDKPNSRVAYLNGYSVTRYHQVDEYLGVFNEILRQQGPDTPSKRLNRYDWDAAADDVATCFGTGKFKALIVFGAEAVSPPTLNTIFTVINEQPEQGSSPVMLLALPDYRLDHLMSNSLKDVKPKLRIDPFLVTGSLSEEAQQ